MSNDTRFWLDKEEEYLEKAWSSMAYGKDDLVRIFCRSWESISKKAARLGLPAWSVLEARAHIEAIEKALKEDHII